ncbi:MAG: hypothetical protein QNJ72_09330 [Pleurocapsa sp. MO_226.B13]|nr:hypothetical protein [Pleurocapsa sp. MO_226.B13]
MNTTKNQFPRGWNEEKVKAVIEYYDNQTEDEAVAEDEAILDNSDRTMMQIPSNLVPVVRELLARHQAS